MPKQITTVIIDETSGINSRSELEQKYKVSLGKHDFPISNISTEYGKELNRLKKEILNE